MLWTPWAFRKAEAEWRRVLPTTPLPETLVERFLTPRKNEARKNEEGACLHWGVGVPEPKKNEEEAATAVFGPIRRRRSDVWNVWTCELHMY